MCQNLIRMMHTIVPFTLFFPVHPRDSAPMIFLQRPCLPLRIYWFEFSIWESQILSILLSMFEFQTLKWFQCNPNFEFQTPRRLNFAWTKFISKKCFLEALRFYCKLETFPFFKQAVYWRTACKETPSEELHRRSFDGNLSLIRKLIVFKRF